MQHVEKGSCLVTTTKQCTLFQAQAKTIETDKYFQLLLQSIRS